MIDHAVNSGLNDKINYRNDKTSQYTESEIKIRYLKLPFVGSFQTNTKES